MRQDLGIRTLRGKIPRSQLQQNHLQIRVTETRARQGAVWDRSQSIRHHRGADSSRRRSHRLLMTLVWAWEGMMSLMGSNCRCRLRKTEGLTIGMSRRRRLPTWVVGRQRRRSQLNLKCRQQVSTPFSTLSLPWDKDRQSKYKCTLCALQSCNSKQPVSR